MLRLILLDIAMFLLPFLLYGAYVYATRASGEDAAAVWASMPWGWLVVAGVVSMVIGLGLLISFGKAPPGGTYVPPHTENGVIKPGRIE